MKQKKKNKVYSDKSAGKKEIVKKTAHKNYNSNQSNPKNSKTEIGFSKMYILLSFSLGKYRQPELNSK